MSILDFLTDSITRYKELDAQLERAGMPHLDTQVTIETLQGVERWVKSQPPTPASELRNKHAGNTSLDDVTAEALESVTAALEQAESRCARYREALEWYADASTMDAIDDYGKRASKALKESP